MLETGDSLSNAGGTVLADGANKAGDDEGKEDTKGVGEAMMALLVTLAGLSTSEVGVGVVKLLKVDDTGSSDGSELGR